MQRCGSYYVPVRNKKQSRAVRIIIACILAFAIIASIATPAAIADGSNGAAEFVTRLYRVCLGREPDAPGHKSWTDNLVNYAITGTEAAYGFLFSAEMISRNLNDGDFTEVLYNAMFGRASDAHGRESWIRRMNDGMPREDVFAGFADSVEFDNICKEYGIIRGSHIDTAGEIRASLDKLAKKYNAASVSITVMEGDGSFFSYQYGYADKNRQQAVNADTKFRVASLSKIVPVICIMSLADNGLINIDADISDYLGYRVRNPRYPNAIITPRMLMQHTSSIYDSSTFEASLKKRSSTDKSVSDLLALNSSYTNRKPGEGFTYTNFGFSVLAAVCETVSGKLIDTLARDILFEPLGIDAAYIPSNLKDTSNIAVIYNAAHNEGDSLSTALSVSSSGILGRDHHLAQGRLTISAQDYARIIYMLSRGGAYNSVRILSEEAVREILNANIIGASYAQGLAVRFNKSGLMNTDVFWHTGSAYGELTQFVYAPGLGRIIVVLTTGCKNTRTNNGMIAVCTDMMKALWS